MPNFYWNASCSGERAGSCHALKALTNPAFQTKHAAGRMVMLEQGYEMSARASLHKTEIHWHFFGSMR
jgi:hypothetical protein